MAKADYKTIDRYHAAFPDATGDMKKVCDVILNTAPKAEEVISYQIPGF